MFDGALFVLQGAIGAGWVALAAVSLFAADLAVDAKETGPNRVLWGWELSDDARLGVV